MLGLLHPSPLSTPLTRQDISLIICQDKSFSLGGNFPHGTNFFSYN